MADPVYAAAAAIRVLAVRLELAALPPRAAAAATIETLAGEIAALAATLAPPASVARLPRRARP